MKYIMFPIDTSGKLLLSPAKFALLPVIPKAEAQIKAMVQAVNVLEQDMKNPSITVEFDNLTIHNHLPEFTPKWFDRMMNEAEIHGAVVVEIPDWAFSNETGSDEAQAFICVPTEYEVGPADIEAVVEYEDCGIEGIKVTRSVVQVLGWVGDDITEDLESPKVGLAYFMNLFTEEQN